MQIEVHAEVAAEPYVVLGMLTPNDAITANQTFCGASWRPTLTSDAVGRRRSPKGYVVILYTEMTRSLPTTYHGTYTAMTNIKSVRMH